MNLTVRFSPVLQAIHTLHNCYPQLMHKLWVNYMDVILTAFGMFLGMSSLWVFVSAFLQKIASFAIVVSWTLGERHELKIKPRSVKDELHMGATKTQKRLLTDFISDGAAQLCRDERLSRIWTSQEHGSPPRTMARIDHDTTAWASTKSTAQRPLNSVWLGKIHACNLCTHVDSAVDNAHFE